jgi:CheY-like chemotaxis protein
MAMQNAARLDDSALAERALESHSQDGLLVLVDSERATREKCAASLRAIGYQVLELDSSEPVVAVVAEQQPKAVLIDISVSGLEGISACANLKSNPSTARTHVMVLSSTCSFAVVRTATIVGADEFLTKPISLRRLISRIQRAETLPRARSFDRAK